MNKSAKIILIKSFFTIFVCVLLMSACSSSADVSVNVSNTKNETGDGQNKSVEPTKVNTETPKPAPTRQSDIFASFKSEDDYKTVIRPKMMKDGWQPARDEEGESNCAGDMPICNEYPELNASPSSPRGDAIFRWKKGEKIVNIYTYDNQIYNKYEFETAKTKEKTPEEKTSDVSGKYVYEYTEDYGGTITFNFKTDNKLDFSHEQEDMTTIGDGSWTWNEAKKTLTATVFAKPEVSIPENESEPYKTVYIFQKVGNDLKLSNSVEGMAVYKGKIFRKK